MINNISNVQLIILLTEAMSKKDQYLVNAYAYELTKRLYIENLHYSFYELLEGFGYRKIEKDSRQISIEEYMRGRKNE